MTGFFPRGRAVLYIVVRTGCRDTGPRRPEPRTAPVLRRPVRRNGSAASPEPADWGAPATRR
ncbi:hypothetical protein SAMN05216259_104427 [Actinacidiphila guanduensis]|uniref:Uncharacterized protein n=1 Tax=Actinacidiphila guanduensis TaxID=310781 RepID=A0A1H0C5F2_9ACTN|nr:hypothetical protein SAMN05216259_104427 [Actinacidiphila guanduensis]